MAGCRIVNQGVIDAIEAIAQSSRDYKSAGEDFIRNLNAAINEMEGAAKDALKTFIDNDVNQFVAIDLPAALEGMSKLLEGNRENFENVDAQIAASISGS